MTVTHPSGFTAAGVPAGLKSTGAKDLALVVNQGPNFDSATVFTANRCKANPVLWSEQVVRDVRRYCPGAFGVSILYGAAAALIPYVTVYLSARIINELAGARRPGVLWPLAVLAVASAAALTFVTGALLRWWIFRREPVPVTPVPRPAEAVPPVHPHRRRRGGDGSAGLRARGGAREKPILKVNRRLAGASPGLLLP